MWLLYQKQAYICFSIETLLVDSTAITILIEEREFCLQKMNYWRILREHGGINETLSTDMIAKEYHSTRELLYFFHFQSHHVEKSFNFTVRTTVCSQREQIIVFCWSFNQGFLNESLLDKIATIGLIHLVLKTDLHQLKYKYMFCKPVVHLVTVCNFFLTVKLRLCKILNQCDILCSLVTSF